MNRRNFLSKFIKGSVGSVATAILGVELISSLTSKEETYTDIITLGSMTEPKHGIIQYANNPNEFIYCGNSSMPDNGNMIIGTIDGSNQERVYYKQDGQIFLI